MIYEVNRHKWPEGTPASRLNELMHLIASTDDPEQVAEFEMAVQEAGEMLSAHLEDMLALRQNLMNSCEAIDLEMKRLQDLRNEREARADRLHTAVIHYMTITERTEVVTDRHTLRIKRNPPKVEVYDEERVPTEYMKETTKVTISVDKKAIAEALKSGADVPGCALIQTSRLEIK
jgi:hypothetical protein